MDKLKQWWFDLTNGCVYPDHWLHQIYDALAGEIECNCCVFYRALAIGFVVALILCLLLALIF